MVIAIMYWRLLEGSDRGLELRPSTYSKWLYGLILGGQDIGPTAWPRQGPSWWCTQPLVELAAKSPAWGKPLGGGWVGPRA